MDSRYTATTGCPTCCIVILSPTDFSTPAAACRQFPPGRRRNNQPDEPPVQSQNLPHIHPWCRWTHSGGSSYPGHSDPREACRKRRCNRRNASPDCSLDNRGDKSTPPGSAIPPRQEKIKCYSV